MAKKAKAKKATAKKNTKKAPKKAAAKKSGSAKSKAAKRPAASALAAQRKVRNASRPRNGNTLSYTQSEFIENIKSFCGLEKRNQAKEICDDIAAFIKDSLKRGYKIPLLGLGKMYVRQTKPRIGRNPATGETIHIGAKKRVRFTAAKTLKETVL